MQQESGSTPPPDDSSAGDPGAQPGGAGGSAGGTTPPPTGGGSGQSSNRAIMLVLSYLGILALVPLLVEKDDQEVQWHAKHGIILLVTWIVLGVFLTIITAIPGIGWIFGCAVAPFFWIAVLVIHIVAIVKALNDDRLVLPVVTDFVQQWK